jgi:hypothetical protein
MPDRGLPRRRFLAATTGAAALTGWGETASAAQAAGSASPQTAGSASPETAGSEQQAAGSESGPYLTRADWIARLTRLAEPVLTHLAQDRLRTSMPIESGPGGKGREVVTHLEAVGRLLAGLAPWLHADAAAAPMEEHQQRERLRTLVVEGLRVATDPTARDRLNFTEGGQPLVDAAFLAQALLRMPSVWARCDAPLQGRLLADLVSTRAIKPGFNNWLLFSATIEAFFASIGQPWDRMRVDYALRQHQQWYKGDGVYGDGPEFHWDYYNGYVIQPMLLDVLDACAAHDPAWQAMRDPVAARARRYAAIQERLIAPDGSFPAIGRSLPYRCGAFQPLAQMALRDALPDGVTPPQAREALSAVIARTLDAPGTFDASGWLRIGLCGHQPGLGESYISTGSLYLCSVAFLPLGLPPASPFWAAPPEPWTGLKVWRGEQVPIDRALRG